MAWWWLLAAGVAEIGFAVSLKQTGGKLLSWPMLLAFVIGTTSFYLLTLAMRDIPVGTAYAIWTGIGVIGVVTVGVFFFNEPMSLARGALLTLLVGSLIGLKLLETA